MEQATIQTPAQPVRLATLDELRRTVIAAHLAPVPSKKTLRGLFDRYRVPRLKPNPLAHRGGGAVYYSVAHVERLMRQLLPGRLT